MDTHEKKIASQLIQSPWLPVDLVPLPVSDYDCMYPRLLSSAQTQYNREPSYISNPRRHAREKGELGPRHTRYIPTQREDKHKPPHSLPTSIQLGSTMKEGGRGEEVPNTTIANEYKHLSPQYELLYTTVNAKGQRTSSYALKVGTNKKFVLLQQYIDKTTLPQAVSAASQYDYWKTIGELSSHTQKIVRLETVSAQGNKAWLVEALMEYGGLPLSKLVSTLKLEDALRLGLRLIQILVIMQRLNIAHLALCLDNILWDQEAEEMKLTPEGSPATFDRSTEHAADPFNGFMNLEGGPARAYAAPEVLREEGTKEGEEALNPQKADVFAFGALVAELLCRAQGRSLATLNRGSTCEAHSNYTASVSTALQQCGASSWLPLIEACLHYDPHKRPTATEAKARFERLAKMSAKTKKSAGHSVDLTQKSYHNPEVAIWSCERALERIKRRTQRKGTKARMQIAAACCTLGFAHVCIKNPTKALGWLRASLKILRCLCTPEHLLVARVWVYLAIAYRQLNDMSPALDCYEKAEQVLAHVYAEGYPELAELYLAMAMTAQKAGHTRTAATHKSRAKEILSRSAVRERTEGAMEHNYLGMMYAELRPLGEGKDGSYGRAVFGNEDVLETVSELQHTAGMYNRHGQRDVAIKLYEEAASVLINACGEDAPGLAKLYNDWGCAYVAKGEYNTAIDYLNKAIQYAAKELVDKDVEDAIYSNMGCAYSNQGNHKKACAAYDKMTETNLYSVQEQVPCIAKAYISLAREYKLNYEYKDAIKSYQKAVNVLEKSQFDIQAFLIEAYLDLGTLYSTMQDYSASIAYFRKAADLDVIFNGKEGAEFKYYQNAAKAYFEAKNYAGALEELQKGEALGLKFYGQDAPKLAEIYSKIVLVYTSMGDNQKAAYYTGKLQELRQESDTGMGQPRRLVIINIPKGAGSQFSGQELQAIVEQVMANQGQKVIGAGENAESLNSIEGIRRGIPGMIATYGERHILIVRLYNNLGIQYLNNKQYAEAIPWFEKALAIMESLGTDDNNELPRILTNMGIAYADLHNYDRAVVFYERALDLYNKHNELYTKSTLNLLIYLSQSTYRTKQYEKALQYTTEAVERFLIAAGPENALTGQAYIKLGRVQVKFNQHRAAIDSFTEGIKSYIPYCGDATDTAAQAYAGLGQAYSALGNPKDALVYLRKAQHILTDLYPGKDKHSLAQVYLCLGECCNALGEEATAFRHFESALEVMTHRYGQDHEGVVDMCIKIGTAFTSVQKPERGLSFLLQAKETSTRLAGDQLAIACKQLGLAYTQLGKFEKAADVLKEARDHYFLLYGENDPMVAQTNVQLASASLKAQRYSLAVESALRAEKSLSSGKPQPQMLADINRILVEAFTQLGDQERAAEYQAKLVASPAP